jgi:hypothetical protein
MGVCTQKGPVKDLPLACLKQSRNSCSMDGRASPLWDACMPPMTSHGACNDVVMICEGSVGLLFDGEETLALLVTGPFEMIAPRSIYLSSRRGGRTACVSSTGLSSNIALFTRRKATVAKSLSECMTVSVSVLDIDSTTLSFKYTCSTHILIRFLNKGQSTVSDSYSPPSPQM